MSIQIDFDKLAEGKWYENVYDVIGEYEKYRMDGNTVTPLEDKLHSHLVMSLRAMHKLADIVQELNDQIEDIFEQFGLGEG